MKFSTWIITIFFMIGGGLIGVVIAFNAPPAWEKSNIISHTKDVSEILFVDHNDPDKVQNDIVYVKTKFGDVYSILHNEWVLLPALPNKEIINKIGANASDTNSFIVATSNENRFYQLEGKNWKSVNEYKEFHWSNEFDQCATTKEWRHPPPVEAGVIDSKGVVFEHTISGFFKCYVLYKDGHLDAWSFEASSLADVGLLQIYCVVGIISGSILSLIFWLYKRFRIKKELL